MPIDITIEAEITPVANGEKNYYDFKITVRSATNEGAIYGAIRDCYDNYAPAARLFNGILNSTIETNRVHIHAETQIIQIWAKYGDYYYEHFFDLGYNNSHIEYKDPILSLKSDTQIEQDLKVNEKIYFEDPTKNYINKEHVNFDTVILGSHKIFKQANGHISCINIGGES